MTISSARGTPAQNTGPVTGQPRLTGYAGFRGFGERRLLFDLDRAALAWTHRNRGLDRATTNDNYLAGALVRWWVKVAAVATAGPLKAHEPIAAGIEPQSHREEEAKLVELPSPTPSGPGSGLSPPAHADKASSTSEANTLFLTLPRTSDHNEKFPGAGAALSSSFPGTLIGSLGRRASREVSLLCSPRFDPLVRGQPFRICADGR
jgi:hypothetical protein